MAYSPQEHGAILAHAKSEGATSAIAGALLWLLGYMIGFLHRDSTASQILFGLAIFTGVGFVIGYLKGAAAAAKIIDEERIRKNSR